MNAAHMHLLLNHFPIVGGMLAVLILATGIIFKSHQIQRLAFFGFFFLAVLTPVVYLTGEPAEESVEHMPGVNEAAIEEHEDAGMFAMAGFIVLGIAGAAAFFLTMKKASFSPGISIGILILSLFVTTIVVRTGYLGGKIRHTEFNQGGAPAGGGGGGEQDDD